MDRPADGDEEEEVDVEEERIGVGDGGWTRPHADRPRVVSPLGLGQPGAEANGADVIVRAAADVVQHDLPVDSIFRILGYMSDMYIHREGSNGFNICPITTLYPQDGVRWNVGTPSLQVFERAQLIRYIHNVGRPDLLRDHLDQVNHVLNISHPLNRESIPRGDAMGRIEEIPNERLEILRINFWCDYE